MGRTHIIHQIQLQEETAQAVWFDARWRPWLPAAWITICPGRWRERREEEGKEEGEEEEEEEEITLREVKEYY